MNHPKIANLETVNILETECSESNAQCESIVQNVRIPLVVQIQMANIDLENLSDESFNYLDSVQNHEYLERMRLAKKQEQERVERAIASRIAAITKEEIRNEAKRLWSLSGQNKQRVSKSDREAARLSLIKKIRGAAIVSS